MKEKEKQGETGYAGAIRQCLKDDSLSLDQRAKINRAVAGLLVNSLNDINKYEIEQAFHHTDENVQNGKDTEGDRWNWLELFRRLPDKFSLIHAFDFVMKWPGGEQLQDVLYYRYVLAFMLYQQGVGDIAVQKVRRLLSDCEIMARRPAFASKAKTPHTTLDLFGKSNAENDTGLFLPFPITKKMESDSVEDARIKENINYRLNSCDRFIGIWGA